MSSKPVSAIAASTKVYSLFPSRLRRGRCPVSRRATWSCNPPQDPSHTGATTHVSAPKRNTDWTTALKKNPYTHGLTPSLLIILNIIGQTVYTFSRFWTNAGQS